MRRTFDIEVPPPPFQEEDEVLDVVLGVTRASRIQLNLDSRQYFTNWTADAGQEEPPPNVVRLSVGPSSRFIPKVYVQSEGEPAEFVKYVVRDGALQPKRVYALKSNPGLVQVDLNDAVGKSFGAKEFLEELEIVIEEKNDEWQDYRRFFARFDLHTNPILWENLEAQKEHLGDWLDPALVPDWDYAAECVSATLDYLMTRVGERVKQHPVVPEFDPFSSDEVQSKGHVEFLSKLQKALYDFKGLKLSEFRKAFELFANGDLRVRLPGLAVTSQPSSGFYVFFAEFALLAIDNKRDTLVWKNRLPFFVRTQRVFAHIYGKGDPSGSEKYESYRSENYEESLEPDQLEEIVSLYDGLAHDDLVTTHSANVHTYLGGETGS